VEYDGDEHRLGRRLVPVGRVVRCRRSRIEFQFDFNFGVIRGETHATGHGPQCRERQGLFHFARLRPFPLLFWIECFATEAAHERRRRIFFRHLDQHEGAFGTLKRQESRRFAYTPGSCRR
jgi:hypothetical protein